jgi:hypothetical protein
LTYNPQSTVSLFFLAELYADEGRPAEAVRLFQQVLEAPLNREYGPEDRFYKVQARNRLQGLAARR